MFGGGGEIALNVNADKVYYIEKSAQLVNIFKNLDLEFVQQVEKCIKKYGLSKTNKQGFLDLRDYYNKELYHTESREQAVVLYCLITHSFNYQMAFNSKRQFNMPSGAGRSYFSDNLKEKLLRYIEHINEKDISFICRDFLDVFITELPAPDKCFIYADPPYLITTGSYERDYFCKWSENYEKRLLSFLDRLNERGYQFALSNVLEHKGKENTLLKEWAKNYNIHYLNADYSNCNYQTNSKELKSSVEVLITNY